MGQRTFSWLPRVVRMPKKSQKAQSFAFEDTLESVYRLWAWILLAWSLYRYFFKFPEYLDEFVFKPLVFLGPVFWFVRKVEHRPLSSLGLTAKKFFPSVYIGLGIGLLFAVEGLAANALKYGKVNINPIVALQHYGLVTLLLLSVVTAFSEEVLSRGFLFQRILEKSRNFFNALFISATLFVLLHVPILVTSLRLQGFTLVLFFVTDFVLSLANGLLFYQTGSVVAPILVHVFWNMTVALYL
jgi:membrane protease YdiL (CAAX protease family)